MDPLSLTLYHVVSSLTRLCLDLTVLLSALPLSSIMGPLNLRCPENREGNLPIPQPHTPPPSCTNSVWCDLRMLLRPRNESKHHCRGLFCLCSSSGGFQKIANTPCSLIKNNWGSVQPTEPLRPLEFILYSNEKIPGGALDSFGMGARHQENHACDYRVRTVSPTLTSEERGRLVHSAMASDVTSCACEMKPL